MKIDTFLHEIKGGSVTIGNYTLWHKPTVIINNTSGERIKYKNVLDALENTVIDGICLKQIIEKASVEDLFCSYLTLDDSDIMVFKDLFPEDYRECPKDCVNLHTDVR